MSHPFPGRTRPDPVQQAYGRQASNLFWNPVLPSPEAKPCFPAHRPQVSRGPPWVAKELLCLHTVPQSGDQPAQAFPALSRVTFPCPGPNAVRHTHSILFARHLGPHLAWRFVCSNLNGERAGGGSGAGLPTGTPRGTAEVEP